MTDSANKNSETEIEIQTVVEVVPVSPAKDPEIAAMVKRLAAIGLNQTAVAIAARIGANDLRKYYMEEYRAGQATMQEIVASAAMEQVAAGNPQMIQFMAKTKLGWNETNIVEHIGEVRAVVSAVPLTKEEFSKRYLEQNSEEDD